MATAIRTIESGTEVYFVQSLKLLRRLAFQALEHTEDGGHSARLGLETLMSVLVTTNVVPQLRDVAIASDDVHFELAQGLEGNPLREVNPLLWQRLLVEVKAVWTSLDTDVPDESDAKSTRADIFCARNKYEHETLRYTEHALTVSLL